MMKFINRLASKTVNEYTRGVSGCHTLTPGIGMSSGTVSDAALVAQNVSWANICADRISKRVAQVPLRLYATRAHGESFKNPKQTRVLNKAERKALVESGIAWGGSRISARKSHQAIQAADVVEIMDHPFIDLMNNINPWSDQFETFEETQQFIDTTGDGYWLVDKDSQGLPTAIWLMPSQNTAIVPSKTDFIAGYLFGCSPEGKRPNADTIGVTPDRVVHFRRPNLRDPYYGMGCLEAVMPAHTLNQTQQRYNIALNDNMGVPSLIATFKDASTTDQSISSFKRLLDKTLRGTNKAGNSFVTTGDMDIKVVGMSQREMSFLNGQKWTRVEICDAYGVPLALVDTENVNRANAQAATYQFEAFTVKPRLKKLADKINSNIIPMYGEPRIFVAFDENVPEDSAFELNRTLSLFSGGITQRNEARASQGLSLLTPEQGGEDFVIIGGSALTSDEGNDDAEAEQEEVKNLIRELITKQEEG